MTIFKWNETCSESVWQSQEDESVQFAVLWAVVSSSLFYPVESGLGAKLLIASEGWAMFFHSPFESLQLITIAAYCSQGHRNWLLAKCLMKGTKKPFFFPLSLHMLQSVAAPCWLCPSCCFCTLQMLVVVISLLSCLYMLDVKNKTESALPMLFCLF